MIHPGDPEYIEHNRQLREAEAGGKSVFLTKVTDQDKRSADFADTMEKQFPELGHHDATRKQRLDAFIKQYGYNPDKDEERFVEEFGFLPYQFLG